MAGGGIASADTLAATTYLERLREVRTLVVDARAAPSNQRAAGLTRAAALLRSTDAITLGDGSTLPIDDSALASRLTGADGAALGVVLGDLDARIAAAARAASNAASPDEIAAEFERLRAGGMRRNDAVKAVAEKFGMRKNDVYRMLL